MSTHSSHSHAADVTHQAPLRGVRVLDLTRLLPGPMCGLHLGDLGAEVIKVEDTGAGDYAAEAVRQLVNRNKRSICIDLKQARVMHVLSQWALWKKSFGTPFAI